MFKGLPTCVIDGLLWNRSDTISAACGVITRKYGRPCALAFTIVSRQFFFQKRYCDIADFYRHHKTYMYAHLSAEIWTRLRRMTSAKYTCNTQKFYSVIYDFLHDRWSANIARFIFQINSFLCLSIDFYQKCKTFLDFNLEFESIRDYS